MVLLGIVREEKGGSMPLRIGRKIGQSFMIGDDIVVTVTRVQKSGLVWVDVKAPRNIEVQREEIYRRIQIERGAKDYAAGHFQRRGND